MAEADPRLREALDDLQGYLADTLAPLLVADAFETLLAYPPALTAEHLRIWSYLQFQGRGGATPVSDILYHAIKKIQLLEVHDLVPTERFAGYLAGLALALLEVCPEAERDRLAGQLRYLRDSGWAATALVDRLHLPGGSAPGAAPYPATAGAANVAPGAGMPAPAAGPSADEVRDLRRFSLALERALSGLAAGGKPAESLSQQLLVLATSGARNDADLEARLARLRESGVGAPAAADLFRSLIGAVPDWAVALPGASRAPVSGSIEAVRRAVKLGGERWQELLKASAEEFNRGAYGRSLALIDLAERMLREGEVDSRTAEIARGNSHESFEVTKLLQAAADRRNWTMLRRLLEFHPAWSVRELLDSLVFQPEAKKRRLLIALLEIWGAESRPVVLDRLDSSIAEQSRAANAWWYQRNLVMLLHRIPRSVAEDVRRELDMVAPFSGLAYHPSFQKEAIQVLAVLPGYAGVPTLVQRLGEAERALEAAEPPHPIEELWKIQGSITAALVRSGSVSARRVVLDHALARRPRDGDSLGRLRELGGLDLAEDRETVGRLLEALRELAPRKLFGIVVGRHDEALVAVARALAGTSLPSVQQALVEVAARFPHLQLDKASAHPVEASSGHAPSAVESVEGESEEFVAEATPLAGRGSLSGDLELFGLAGLLQTFAQSETTGRLTLRDSHGRGTGEVALHRGKLVDCRAGRLAGDMAFYQLLEAPNGGTFEFSRLEPGAAPPPGVREIMGLMMEGMRRYDKLQRLQVVVPDRLVLRAGTARPTSPPDETDGNFVRQLWERVRAGAAVADCEAAIAADSFRIRALLAHWLEEGSAVSATPSG